MPLKILVTGAAGFIGGHTCLRLIKAGHSVVAIDNLSDYYDVKLKQARLENLGIHDAGSIDFGDSETTESGLTFSRLDISDRAGLINLFKTHDFDMVCHLAAQVGVRKSIEFPFEYVDTNVRGFLNVLDCCQRHGVGRLVYASSSSVYGKNKKTPSSTADRTDSPVSIYAATKKSNELMAHTYSQLYNIECIGLRFFTVYGPWGRPDMAMFLFTDAILRSKPLKVFNQGNLSRDFTYIDDIVSGILSVLVRSSPKSVNRNRVYNIGNSNPVKIIDFINTIEDCTGRKAFLEMLPMQPGDVTTTYADISGLSRDYGYAPSTDIRAGVEAYVKWFKSYYKM